MKAQINVEFNESPNRQELQSGEEIKTLFGKIKKWLTDLKPVAFSGSYNDLEDKLDTYTKTEVDNKIRDIEITTDSEMSDTSENAVQNKVIKAYVDNSLSSNITYGTDDLTAGTSPLATGTVYLVYEE